MEVDLLHRHTMGMALRLGNETIDRQHILPHTLRQIQMVPHQMGNVPQAGVAVTVGVFVVMRMSMIMVVVVIVPMLVVVVMVVLMLVIVGMAVIMLMLVTVLMEL